MFARYRELSDGELVRIAQGGQNAAFDELVRRYQTKVYRLAYKILRHEDDAGEALQDAFLSAYRGLRSFKEEASFSTWLYRIATNASLMKVRKRRLNHISLEQSRDDEAEPYQLPDWSAQPPEELLTAETREMMEEGIQHLPPELRAVFVLRDIEGLSNAEVAEVLRLTVAAVKSRLHRARVVLRARLSRYFADSLGRRERVASGA